jgi:hypothetical protein
MRIAFFLTSVFCLLTSSTNAAPALRTLPTQHYLIHTDLEPAFAGDLAKRMEAMYAEYTRRLEDFKPSASATKLEVYLFTHKEDYDAITLHQVPHTGGVFIAGRRNLLASFLEGQGRDAMRKTLQHEAFHQFAFNAIASDLPIWLNEAMAQFFEEGIWDGSTFRIGEVPPWRVRQLQDDLKTGHFIDFEKLFALTPEEWAMRLRRDVTTGATEYNESWAIIQYLAKGPGRYQPHLIAWLKAMHEGTPAEEAFASSFSENPRQLQARFMEWARTLQPSERAAMLEHQKILADMLAALKAHGQTFNNIAQFRTTAVEEHLRIHYTLGQVTWTTDENPAIYFADRTGRLMMRDQLYLEPSFGAPLPDIVCRCGDGATLRAHFYKADKEIESEILTTATR